MSIFDYITIIAIVVGMFAVTCALVLHYRAARHIKTLEEKLQKLSSKIEGMENMTNADDTEDTSPKKSVPPIKKS
jgi:uncharacterized membrane-anchored protein YhcB (DUF1043 family)